MAADYSGKTQPDRVSAADEAWPGCSVRRVLADLAVLFRHAKEMRAFCLDCRIFVPHRGAWCHEAGPVTVRKALGSYFRGVRASGVRADRVSAAMNRVKPGNSPRL